ncbi:transcriptional regulator [Arthrobacter sp. NicSoilE8]|nr:transcriptional regulator [Arthrobacter sp. NicSoilE8]
MNSKQESQSALGERLHELRSQHRYSIRGLAAKAGVSASLVSDVEKGKVEPSISTLTRLASAMGTTITYFFSPQAQSMGRVVKAVDRVPFGGVADPASGSRPASGTRFELASPTDLHSIEAIYGHYDVGGWFGEEPFTHEGEEWGFVLSGRLKVILGDEVHFLDPGDSIWFPSTVPHRMENVADTPTQYIWIDIPPRN